VSVDPKPLVRRAVNLEGDRCAGPTGDTSCRTPPLVLAATAWAQGCPHDWVAIPGSGPLPGGRGRLPPSHYTSSDSPWIGWCRLCGRLDVCDGVRSISRLPMICGGEG